MTLNIKLWRSELALCSNENVYSPSGCAEDCGPYSSHILAICSGDSRLSAGPLMAAAAIIQDLWYETYPPFLPDSTQ